MKLSSIQPEVQQIAQTISAVLNLDTEIVDNDLVICGGTGKYAQEIGSYEEDGLHNGPFLYGRVLREGIPYIIEDTSSPDYDPDSLKGNAKELAEICCPIQKDDNTLGVIALIAFTEGQKKRLLKKKAQYLTFIQRMAFLLASLASENEAKHEVAILAKEQEVVLSGIEQGILLINDTGCIKQCNVTAAQLMMIENTKQIVGKNVSVFWPFSPIMRIIDSNQKYVEHLEYIDSKRRLILTARPINWQKKAVGAVVYLHEKKYKNPSTLTKESEYYSFNNIIGKSNAICKLKEQAMKVSPSNTTILLTGESGTGKELFAKAIHDDSFRRNGPFVQVNCGAIPENLLESEFFGYEGGAFTGANREGKPGKFELATGGTIFLDEIGDLAPQLQCKLLHALENKAIERVGGVKPIQINVRIIAATNRDIEQMVQTGKFREDLYFRLSVIPLHVPALRERKEDIPELLEFYLKKQIAETGKGIKGLTTEALNFFLQYDWPGNIRELENAIIYSVTMENEKLIHPNNIPSRMKHRGKTPFNNSLHEKIQEKEKAVLLAYLNDNSAYPTKAELARALKISRTTLYRKLKKFNIIS